MEEYTNRELGLLLKEIKTHLVGFSETNKIEHKDMCDHVIRTNGRVKSLEIWRSFIVGGLSIVTLVFPFVIYQILK